MHWQQQSYLLVGGKFQWVTDLMVEADNHKPIAYIVALICFMVVIVGLCGIVIEYNRCTKGTCNWRSFAQVALELLLGISIPAVLLFSIVSRLLA